MVRRDSFQSGSLDDPHLEPGWGRYDQRNKITRRAAIASIGLVGAGAALAPLVEHELSRPSGNSKSGGAHPPETGSLVEEKPPEGIPERIAFEIKRAERLLARAEVAAILQSPWLVSALYYSDSFLEHAQEAPENPAQEILRGIAPLITPALRKEFAKVLDTSMRPFVRTLPSGEKRPLAHFDFGVGENHPDAIDLFTEEGAPVSCIVRGVVLSAESAWEADNPFSTSSPKGGNNVIVYSPDERAFYRYCHLGKVSAEPGTVVRPGHTLGTVGRTGEHAKNPGHGQHLHLEINRLSADGGMDAIPASVLKERLKRLSA
jgi:murein DD-endopeptidase MepM/ murein hydrolase activator NlpD